MLEPEEVVLVRKARFGGMRFVEEEAKRRGRLLLPIETESVYQTLQPMLEMYRLLTGFAETNPNAIMHHEVEQYGPACPQCTKPLRTPEARFCAACGFGQEDVTASSLPLPQRRPELFT